MSHSATALMTTRSRKRAIPPSWQRPGGSRTATVRESARRRLVAMPVTLRPEISALPPYRQGRPAAADAFKLSSNESPFPPLPSVLAAISGSSFNRYPDGSAAALRVRLAERHGVTVDEVHAGAGIGVDPQPARPGRGGRGRRGRLRVAIVRGLPGHRDGGRRHERAGAEPARRRARPRRDGGRGDGPHPGRHRLLAEQPDERRGDRGRVRDVHGPRPGHAARDPRRGVPRVRHRPAGRRRHPSSRALPEPRRAPHLLEGVRARRTPDRLRGRTGLHPRRRAVGGDPALGHRAGAARRARRPRRRGRAARPGGRAERATRARSAPDCSSRAGRCRSRRATSSGSRPALARRPRPRCSRPAGSSGGCSLRRGSGCRSARRSLWRNSYGPPPRLSRPSHLGPKSPG